METKKNTKKDYFLALKEFFRYENGTVEIAGIDSEEMIEFLDKQIAQIVAKSEKAKAKAADKKACGDALREKIAAVLTDEFQTVDAIVAQVEGEDITKSKVVARLTQLIENGTAVKEQVKDEATNRKVMAYKLA